MNLLPSIYYSLSDIAKETHYRILRVFLAKVFPNTYHSLHDKLNTLVGEFLVENSFYRI